MRILFLLLSASLAMSVGAQESSELLKCSTIGDDVKRLECFDALAKKEQFKSDEGEDKKLSPPKSTDNWTVRIDESPIDDSKTVVLVSDSKNEVSGRFGNASRPSLVLRCLENTTSAFINFDGLHMADIQGYGDITFRVDKNKAFTRKTDVSTDNKALGFWRGGNAIPFIKQLFNGDTLLVQATPFSESPVTFTIDISGIESVIKPLRQACQW